MLKPPPRGLAPRSRGPAPLPLASIRRLIEKASCNRLPVLLLGESGTGKEVVARAILTPAPGGNSCPSIADRWSAHSWKANSSVTPKVRSAARRKQSGTHRAGRRRHRLFRRDRRHAAGHAGQTATPVQESEFRAVGSISGESRPPHRRRHPSRPEGRSRRRPLPSGSVLPPQRFQHSPATLRDRKDDCRCWWTTSSTAADGSPPSNRAPTHRSLESYDWPGNVRELKHCVERIAPCSQRARSADVGLAIGPASTIRRPRGWKGFRAQSNRDRDLLPVALPRPHP